MNRNQKIFLMIIVLLTFSLRFYNASDLSGGDDSQLAELATLALQDPSRIIYPSFPDEPISWANLHYSRPLTALVYSISILLLGYTKHAIIFPGTLFAALSAILLYQIMKKQFNLRVAVIATLLFAFSPFLLAFTRIGLLHSQIIFFSLLAYFFLLKYTDTSKIKFIYLSTLCWLLIAWTVELRGLVTILAILPILYTEIRNRTTTLLKHLVISFTLVGIIYVVYVSIPLLYGNAHYVETMARMFKSATGSVDSTAYLPFLSAVKELGKYIFITPFVGLITIPLIFGLIKSLRHIKIEKNLFWLFYLFPIILFYMQGQVVPERQLVFLPAFVVFAAIGLDWCYKSYSNKSCSVFSFMFPLTLVYGIICVKSFQSLFVSEWTTMADKYWLVNFVGEHVILIALLTYVVGYGFVVILDRKPTLSVALIVVIIGLNIGFCFAATLSGEGIYKRTDATSMLGSYLNYNLGDEKYSCIAGIHDKSFTFYTNRLCAFYDKVNVSWMDQQTRAGNLKYFVINLHYYEGTPGLGLFDLNGNPDNNNIMKRSWHKNHYDKINWLNENTVDITNLTGLAADNPYYRLRTAKHLNIS